MASSVWTVLAHRLLVSWVILSVILDENSSNYGTQEGLAVASIARDDPSTLPGDDPFPRAGMHRDRNARQIEIEIWNVN